jgi:hypothetical protein
MDALSQRLREYPQKRWQRNEAFNIINEFLLTPYLPEMIENLNKVHRIKVCINEHNHITALKLQFERDKKPGLWNAIKRFFCHYETGVYVWYNGQLFLCEYYKHSFFEMCDKVKVEYDNKLKTIFGCDFVIVCRAK